MNDELSKHVVLNAILELLPRKELPDYREGMLATLSEIVSSTNDENEENNILRKILKQDKRIVLIHGCYSIIESKLMDLLEIGKDQICSLRNYRVFKKGRRVFPIFHKSIFEQSWNKKYDLGIKTTNEQSKTLEEIWRKYIDRKTELEKIIDEDKEMIAIMETYSNVLKIIQGGNTI